MKSKRARAELQEAVIKGIVGSGTSKIDIQKQTLKKLSLILRLNTEEQWKKDNVVTGTGLILPLIRTVQWGKCTLLADKQDFKVNGVLNGSLE